MTTAFTFTASPTATAAPSAFSDLPGNQTKKWWTEVCANDPSLVYCDVVPAYYNYNVSLAANALFLTLFIISLIGFGAVYIATRRGLGFTVAMLLGVLLEILGYAGRTWSSKNRWEENPFLMQICCLTIAPAFLAAGIYLCLRRIVYVFGAENSRIPPEYYTRIFIPCDVISLILQAAGGAIASIDSHANRSVDTGDNIMIAGLAMQVATLLIFIVCSLDFALRTIRRTRALGDAALVQNDVARRVRGSWLFRGFLGALALATLLIFWRSAFRVAELSKGWDGPIISDQGMFIGFEGVLIIVACFALNVFHPSICFKEMMEGMGGFGSKKAARASRVVRSEEIEHKGDPTSDSDKVTV